MVANAVHRLAGISGAVHTVSQHRLGTTSHRQSARATGEGKTMAAHQDDTRAAVDLILQPWLLEVLDGAESGHTPQTSAGVDADPDQVHAAVAQLTSIGAVIAQDDGPSADKPLTLTPRGAELLVRLR